MDVRRTFHELKQNYEVKDLTDERSDKIFVLESPHTQELKHGVPVAGSSGASMTKILFKIEKKPLGIFISEQRTVGKEYIKSYGIMNICPIPMQRKAYSDKQLEQKHNAFFDAIEAIRSSGEKKVYKNADANVLQEIILDDFRSRIASLNGRKALIIPCGKFAEKLFRLSGASQTKWETLVGVPHPSYNSWSRSVYKSVIDGMKTKLNIDIQ